MAKATTADETTTQKVAKTGKPGKAAPAPKPSFFARMGQYFRDVRTEMTRVVWPTRSEVLNSSVVVVVTLIFFILFIALTDLVVQEFLKLIAGIR
jgi:preprotein translocase subunit SecE